MIWIIDNIFVSLKKTWHRVEQNTDLCLETDNFKMPNKPDSNKPHNLSVAKSHQHAPDRQTAPAVMEQTEAATKDKWEHFLAVRAAPNKFSSKGTQSESLKPEKSYTQPISGCRESDGLDRPAAGSKLQACRQTEKCACFQIAIKQKHVVGTAPPNPKHIKTNDTMCWSWSLFGMVAKLWDGKRTTSATNANTTTHFEENTS